MSTAFCTLVNNNDEIIWKFCKRLQIHRHQQTIWNLFSHMSYMCHKVFSDMSVEKELLQVELPYYNYKHKNTAPRALKTE